MRAQLTFEEIDDLEQFLQLSSFLKIEDEERKLMRKRLFAKLYLLAEAAPPYVMCVTSDEYEERK